MVSEMNRRELIPVIGVPHRLTLYDASLRWVNGATGSASQPGPSHDRWQVVPLG